MLRLRRLVMDHRRILAAGCAALAVLAALTSLQQDHEGPRAVVAARDLSSGTVLTADDVRDVRLGQAHSVSHTLPASAVIGARLAGAVREGEVLTDRRLLGSSVGDDRDRGTVVTTLALESGQALGPARVGDRVDVVAVAPERAEAEGDAARVVARDVQVLAIRQEEDAEAVLLDVAAPSDVVLDLVTAGQRARLSVLVSTPAPARR